jgi:IstB-like ATP binding protein
MRLPYLRHAAPDVIATAKAQRWDPAEVLRVLINEEVIGRDAATRRMRRKTANFPTGKTFATWRPDESSIPAPTQQALSTLEWIGRAENLAVAGPSGTGKSHFIEAHLHRGAGPGRSRPHQAQARAQRSGADVRHSTHRTALVQGAFSNLPGHKQRSLSRRLWRGSLPRAWVSGLGCERVLARLEPDVDPREGQILAQAAAQEPNPRGRRARAGSARVNASGVPGAPRPKRMVFGFSSRKVPCACSHTRLSFRIDQEKEPGMEGGSRGPR